VADDQDMSDMMNQVDACYTEAGETEPPMLKLAMQLFGGKGGAGGNKFGAAFSVSASSVIIASDMMALDADDPTDCQSCPNF